MDLQCEAAKERNAQRIELEKVVQVSKCDDKDADVRMQKVAGTLCMKLLLIPSSRKSECSSYAGRHNIDLHY
jgi:hypothetical protein